MRRWLRGGLGAALILSLCLFAACPAGAADWTEFGGSPLRQHRAEDQATLPLSSEDWFWTPIIGVSCSQPLVVGDTLYVLAAKGQTYTPPAAGLYAFDLKAMENWPPGEPPVLEPLPGYPIRLNADPENYEPSQGHVTYDPATGGFYWGTADGCLAAWKPGMGEPNFVRLYEREAGDIRVVSAPLVLSPDVVAVGTSSGGVWVVGGLLTGQERFLSRVWLPGSVTSSFVQVGPNRFLVGVDGIGGRGEVRCYMLSGSNLVLYDSWGDHGRIVTPAGVPASFAVDGPHFYFSDKFGTFYKAELATGKVVWARRFDPITAQRWAGKVKEEIRTLEELYALGPETVAIPADGLFINHSPAVGDDLVYWTVRTSDRRSPRGEAGWEAPGLLVALSKADGSLRWAVVLPGNGNTCPLVWPYAHRVLVGGRGVIRWSGGGASLDSWISCWDTESGKPRALMVMADSGNVYCVIGVGGLWAQIPGLPSWSQLSGAGVEPTLTHGVLVLGAGGVDPDLGQLTGNLEIQRLRDPVNLRIKDASREPSGPVDAGAQVTVRAAVELAEGDAPVDTWVGWRWKGESEWRRVQDLTLGPEVKEVAVSFPVTAPSSTQTLEVKVNPDELHPPSETYYGDNAADVTVEVNKPLDITLKLIYPVKLWTGMRVAVWTECWVWHGPAVDTEVVFSCNGVSARAPISLPAGEPGRPVRTQFEVEAFEEGVLHLRAEVNPRRNPVETRWDNNVFSVDVPVEWWSQGRTGAGIKVRLVK
ncbi:MAG: hypothetical protein AB1816_05135 [Bacillota bacterium]